jgi:UDP-glucose 4-epimerase
MRISARSNTSYPGARAASLNLANAQGYSVLEVIQVAERVSGKAIRVDMTPRRPGDPAVLIGSADRARATRPGQAIKRAVRPLNCSNAGSSYGGDSSGRRLD